MNASIRKEIRSLAPVLLMAVVAITAASFLFVGHDAAAIVNIIFIFCCVILGALAWGSEFQSRTMPLLLAQPMRRQRIWFNKMMVLGTALALVFATTLFCVRFFIKKEAQPDDFSELVLTMLVAPVLIFCLAPSATLVVKNVIGSMVITVVLAGGACFLVPGNKWLMEKLFPHFFQHLRESFSSHPFICLVTVGTIYLLPSAMFCAGVYWLGYRGFLRLELIEGQGQEVALPARLEKALGKLTKWFLPGYSSPTASLIRKELHVQRASYLFAGLVLLLLPLEAVASLLSKAAFFQILLLATFAIYVIAIPFLAGSVCMAEERNWGVAAWQLTMPVSSFKQRLVKLAVTILTCFVLGVVLPMFLLSSGHKWLGIGTGRFDFEWGLALFYIIFFTIIVYSSSRSKSALKAIVLSLGLVTGLGCLGGVYEFINRATDSEFSTMLGNFILYERGVFYELIGLMILSVWLVSYHNFGKVEPGFGRFRNPFEAGWAFIRKPVILGSILIIVIGFCGWEMFRDRGPQYEGKPLIEWIKGYDRSGTSLSSEEVSQSQRIREANEAVQQIGTKALPLLESMAGSNEPKIRERAFHAFFALGNKVQPAMALLKASLYEAAPIGHLAAGAIANCGLEGIRVLTNEVVKASSQEKVSIIIGLWHYGTYSNGKRKPTMALMDDVEFESGQLMIIPVLVDLLNDASTDVARWAAVCLGRIHKQPDIVVPQLVERLKKTDRKSKYAVIYALGRYGEQARGAVPEILSALKDQEKTARDAATNTLKQIDPEMAAKIGIK